MEMLLYVSLCEQNTLQKYKQTNFDRIMERRALYDNITLLDTFLETW